MDNSKTLLLALTSKPNSSHFPFNLFFDRGKCEREKSMYKSGWKFLHFYLMLLFKNDERKLVENYSV